MRLQMYLWIAVSSVSYMSTISLAAGEEGHNNFQEYYNTQGDLNSTSPVMNPLIDLTVEQSEQERGMDTQEELKEDNLMPNKNSIRKDLDTDATFIIGRPSSYGYRHSYFPRIWFHSPYNYHRPRPVYYHRTYYRG